MTWNHRTNLSLLLLLAFGCSPSPGADDAPAGDADMPTGSEVISALTREAGRVSAAAASIDSVFQPLPLLSPADEEVLRRFSNSTQLGRARQLGVGRELPPRALAELTEAGRLVPLEDSDYWVVRDLDHSQPLVVPAVRSLLTEIGTRFQSRLAELGSPAYRMEVSSVLRSAQDQEALRRVNPNAALGESTHEYGTTVDVLYSAYAAPVRSIVDLSIEDAPALEEFLATYAAVAAERVAARRSLELKAVLGHVLIQMQNEGRVMVTLERLQPVFHMTVAAE